MKTSLRSIFCAIVFWGTATTTVTAKLENLLKTAEENDFSVFIDALAILADAGSDLIDELESDDITVFIPTDEAWENFKEENPEGFEFLLANEEALEEVIAYHMVEGAFFAEDLPQGLVDVVTLFEDAVLSLNRMGDKSAFYCHIWECQLSVDINEDTSVVESLMDIEAKNGIIHGIDKVLIPSGVLPEGPDSGEEQDDAPLLPCGLTDFGCWGDAIVEIIVDRREKKAKSKDKAKAKAKGKSKGKK